jgi:hypothetical protein
MEEIKLIKNAIRRIESKWAWVIEHHPKAAREAEESCRPGRPKKDKEVSLAVDGKAAVAAYCSAYKNRYQTAPEITGFVAKRLKDMAKELGQEKLKEYVNAYLAMNDQWFIKRGHDVDTFTKNLNKIKLYCDRGVQVTAQEAITAEKLTKNAEVMSGL